MIDLHYRVVDGLALSPEIVSKLKTRLPDRPQAGCWKYAGQKARDGYGQFRANGRRYSAHRIAYTAFVGEIPDGMLVLHECDNPSCCNPRHLSVGDQSKNMADCVRRKRHKEALKTHCSNGHEFTEANTRMYGRKRKCRACERERRLTPSGAAYGRTVIAS